MVGSRVKSVEIRCKEYLFNIINETDIIFSKHTLLMVDDSPVIRDSIDCIPILDLSGCITLLAMSL